MSELVALIVGLIFGFWYGYRRSPWTRLQARRLSQLEQEISALERRVDRSS